MDRRGRCAGRCRDCRAYPERAERDRRCAWMAAGLARWRRPMRRASRRQLGLVCAFERSSEAAGAVTHSITRPIIHTVRAAGYGRAAAQQIAGRGEAGSRTRSCVPLCLPRSSLPPILLFQGKKDKNLPFRTRKTRRVARLEDLTDKLGLLTRRTPTSNAQTTKQWIVRRGVAEEAGIVICSRLASPWRARSSTSEGTNSMQGGGRKKRLIDYASCAG